MSRELKKLREDYINGEKFYDTDVNDITTDINLLIDKTVEIDNGKQDKLTPGTNITIDSANTISVTGLIDDDAIDVDVTWSSERIDGVVSELNEDLSEDINNLSEDIDSLSVAVSNRQNLNYFKFTASQVSTVQLQHTSSHQWLLYSIDGGTHWSEFTSSTILSLSNGQSVILRGMLSGDNDSSTNYTTFAINGSVAVSGNINTLWNYIDLNRPLREFCAYKLFDGCTGLTDASDLELPATNLESGCYYSMFNGCTRLEHAPKVLPAKELVWACYYSMFHNCWSLADAPQIMAETLAQECCGQMFRICTSLTTAPVLHARNLITSCYFEMFLNCTSLNHVECLADVPSTSCCSNWLSGVAATGTFITANKDTQWSVGTSGIPSGWTVYSEYASNIINDLASSTTTTYSSGKITEMLADAGFDVEIVSSLPASGDTHTIYFMPPIDSGNTGSTDYYDEYMWVNNDWELIGSTRIDLSQYYTADEIDDALDTKVESTTIKTIWSGTQQEYDALQTYSNDTLYIIK